MSKRLLRSSATVREVLHTVTSHARACPCHSCTTRGAGGLQRLRRSATNLSTSLPDYAFQMETSTLRFGRGIVREVGYDLEELGAQRVAVVTDPRLATTVAFERAVEALDARKIKFSVYDQVRCEPTDASMRAACDWANAHGEFDAFLAIGGGSSIDTAKCANLMMCHPGYEVRNGASA